MDGFTYINIFDTKGAEYLVIIVFLLLLVPYWRLLNRPIKQKVPAKVLSGILSVANLKIPQGIYYSRNHTWTHLEKSGIAMVGLDDFLLHITGEVAINNFKIPGDRVKKGELMADISHAGATLGIKSPIAGEIAAVNTSLRDNSKRLSDDPYGKGWIYQLKPDNWIIETASFFMANQATLWFKTELLRFKDFIVMSTNRNSPNAVLYVLQEGGELADNTLSEMPTEIWRDFQEQFLDQVN